MANVCFNQLSVTGAGVKAFTDACLHVKDDDWSLEIRALLPKDELDRKLGIDRTSETIRAYLPGTGTSIHLDNPPEVTLTSFSATFCSRWGPPSGLGTLLTNHFDVEVELRWQEPGMNVSGLIRDTKAEHYEEDGDLEPADGEAQSS